MSDVAVLHEPVALDVEIGECAGHLQAVHVLGKPPVAHMCKAEDALDDQEWMLALGPDLVLFFKRSVPDKGCPRAALLLVMSLAEGAAAVMAAFWP